MTSGERYHLELVTEPSDVPPIIRLRQALKYLKRVQGLRCTVAEELPVPPPTKGLSADATGDKGQ